MTFFDHTLGTLEGLIVSEGAHVMMAVVYCLSLQAQWCGLAIMKRSRRTLLLTYTSKVLLFEFRRDCCLIRFFGMMYIPGR